MEFGSSGIGRGYRIKSGTGSVGFAFDQLAAWSLRRAMPRPLALLLAAAAMVVVAVVRAALVTDLLPWLLFIPAILVVSLILGELPGLFATFVAAALAGMTIGDASRIGLLTHDQWIATVLFVLVTSGVVALAGALRAALRRAADLNSGPAEARERQQLLNGELGHRLKNMLAVVQSIANQTARTSETVEEVNAKLSERLASLGKATDVLTAADWSGALIRDVAQAGLTSIQGMNDRVVLEGPAIELEAQPALGLTLALHELATNATKYGALSGDGGKVILRWSIDPTEPSTLRIEWREVDGPPVMPPSRKGFGSAMIERSMRSLFRGSAVLTYEPAGVRFVIEAPLENAVCAS